MDVAETIFRILTSAVLSKNLKSDEKTVSYLVNRDYRFQNSKFETKTALVPNLSRL